MKLKLLNTTFINSYNTYLNDTDNVASENIIHNEEPLAILDLILQCH